MSTVSHALVALLAGLGAYAVGFRLGRASRSFARATDAEAERKLRALGERP